MRRTLIQSGLAFVSAAALVFAALQAGPALARDVWTDPYPGARHLRRRVDRMDVHVVLIDLRAADVSVVATRPSDRAVSVRDFGSRYGSDIAINANYFDGAAKSCGLAAGDGHLWRDSYADGCDMSMGFGRRNQVAVFESAGLVRGPLPERWMTDVVTGKPWLVRNGVVYDHWARPRHIRGRHPRTAIGLTRNRRTLILVVADGRREGVPGMTGRELATLMAGLGAYDALNLDGGGSSELWIRSENGVQNRPSDGRARSVGNHLGIRIRPSRARPITSRVQGETNGSRLTEPQRPTAGEHVAPAQVGPAARRSALPRERGTVPLRALLGGVLVAGSALGKTLGRRELRRKSEPTPARWRRGPALLVRRWLPRLKR